MKKMTFSEMVVKQAFGYKFIHLRKKIYAAPRFLSSKKWNPFDWYLVEIIAD